MDITSLNNFIEEYYNSCSFGSIMVTSDWGTGKSYYLENDLKPYLEQKNVRTLVVSLHGLSNSFEVSKAIYLEYLLFKAKAKPKKIVRKKAKVAALAVKTVVKGVASYFNVDINCSEQDLLNLYESIDFNNLLLVLEDVERTKMDSVELLAYINNLVEYDNVKVLLIANEKELKNKGGDEYKAIKEKTVCDTRDFTPDVPKAITNILKKCKSKLMCDFLNSENDNDVFSKKIENEITHVAKFDSVNLRSVIYGCDKIDKILNFCSKKSNSLFLTNLIISVLVFTQKLKRGDVLKWESLNEESSAKLGTYTYPLFKFAYDYIVHDYLDQKALNVAEESFLTFLEKEKMKSMFSSIYKVISECYLRPEIEVKEAIDKLLLSLKQNTVPLNNYFNLANYLIFIKNCMSYDKQINECLSLMLENVSGLEEEEVGKMGFLGGIALESQKENEEFEEFRSKFSEIVKKNNLNPLMFSYDLKDLDSFCDGVAKSHEKYIMERSFASRIDSKRLGNLLKQCSAAQINEIRRAYLSVYSFSNIKEYFFNDKDSIKELLDIVSKMKNDKCFDAFQKKQMQYFENNLIDIHNRLQ